MAKKSFEDSLEKLEQITSELEDGDLSLEKSLKKFDEGVKLAEYCNKKLEDAQKKVDLLLNKNGELTAVPFESATNSGPDLTD
jgi:exodeoxyribonuclease VII small subunit